MLSLRLKPEYHRYLFFFGLALMAVGLPFSKAFMSISQFVLAGNWVWEGGFEDKWKKFRHNKAAQFLCSLPVLYALGLFYSSDTSHAFHEIRIKLPLLVLPLIVSTSALLSKNEFTRLMQLFSASVIASSFVSVSAYFGFTGNNIGNLRDVSVFISHIRFSLLICIAILFLFYSAIQVFYSGYDSGISSDNKFIAVLQLAGALWLGFFLFLIESMTGVAALFFAVLTLSLLYSFRQNTFSLKIFYAGGALLVPSLFAVYLLREVQNFYKIKTVDFSALEEFASNGEKYVHDTLEKKFENGNYVWLYYAPKSLGEAWNKRSGIKIHETDGRGQSIHYTLIRFLTSKNSRKDAEGVYALTEEEIKAIERGDANVNYMESGLTKRIHQIIWEFNNYFNGENPQGNSITQRLEFWKAGWKCIKQDPVLGVGTGDLKNKMDAQYVQMNTLLEPQYWLKPHNQFITITVMFGFAGFAWFLMILVVPPWLQKSWKDYFYLSFFVVAVLSMLTEDTLDTQAGVSFFTFFSCLFLFRK